VPIVSVDYSLSPEAPFGVALHECYYAYAWALANAPALCTSGDIVSVSGDSAGGNLCMAATLKIIQVRWCVI
jgi:hormone-sensitive lipase